MSHQVSDPSRGRVDGWLAEGEDRDALAHGLRHARELVLSGEVSLLLHGDHRPELADDEKQRRAEARLARLRDHRLKRYVFALQTAAGPRIVKISEVLDVGHHLLGLLGTSSGRREHRDHERGERVGIAATQTRGFLEWRSRGRLMRSCQIQTVLPRDHPTLDVFLREELARAGDEALDPLADAFADMHRRRFFHGDLKGFHAFPWDIRPGSPARYTLRWLDLGRVGYRLSRRQRIINLYQILRFVLPDRPEAQERFVQRYCTTNGWCAKRPERALRTVRRFLDYKRRTHPNPQL